MCPPTANGGGIWNGQESRSGARGQKGAARNDTLTTGQQTSVVESEPATRVSV